MAGEAPAVPSSVAATFWPWTARLAILAVPVTLTSLLIVYGLVRSTARWPKDHYQGWTLLGILLLSCLPILLLLLEAVVTSGGTIQAPGGVKLSFQAASARIGSTVSTTTLSENLGTLDSEPVGQSGMRSILRSLRASERTDVTIVDLREGHTWWESRFFIVVASAARRPARQALAVVATKNEIQQSFVGWADPIRLLQLQLATQPDLNDAHQRAAARTLEWQLARDGTPTMPNTRTTPWGTQVSLPWLIDEQPDPNFAFELYLQDELDRLAIDKPALRDYVTVNRVDQLFASALVTDSIDETASTDDWVRMLSGPPRRFFALTTSGVLRTLVPRDALLVSLIETLVRSNDQSAPS